MEAARAWANTSRRDGKRPGLAQPQGNGIRLRATAGREEERAPRPGGGQLQPPLEPVGTAEERHVHGRRPGHAVEDAPLPLPLDALPMRPDELDPLCGVLRLAATGGRRGLVELTHDDDASTRVARHEDLPDRPTLSLDQHGAEEVSGQLDHEVERLAPALRGVELDHERALVLEGPHAGRPGRGAGVRPGAAREAARRWGDRSPIREGGGARTRSFAPPNGGGLSGARRRAARPRPGLPRAPPRAPGRGRQRGVDPSGPTSSQANRSGACGPIPDAASDPTRSPERRASRPFARPRPRHARVPPYLCRPSPGFDTPWSGLYGPAALSSRSPPALPSPPPR